MIRGLLLVAALAACGEEVTEPDFPSDYAASFTEVRNCRSSADHDLHKIRIVADPAALAPYNARTDFPEGAIVLKEEYDFADGACAGPILQWTVMTKLAEPNVIPVRTWRWQRVDAARTVVEEDAGRCTNCHAGCGNPPDGFDGTCAMP